MRKFIRFVSAVTDYTGRYTKWLVYALIVVVVIDVVLRYVFNRPPVWAYDVSVMLGGTIYVLAFAYTHRYNGHVRVDVFYAHLSPRKKAVIDAAGTFFCIVPLMVLLMMESWEWMWRAWKINERFMETYFYPPVAPFRTIVLIGFGLLLLQAIAELIKNVYFVVKNKPYA